MKINPLKHSLETSFCCHWQLPHASSQVQPKLVKFVTPCLITLALCHGLVLTMGPKRSVCNCANQPAGVHHQLYHHIGGHLWNSNSATCLETSQLPFRIVQLSVGITELLARLSTSTRTCNIFQLPHVQICVRPLPFLTTFDSP